MTLEELAAIDLPTSDESEELLRVRHTVSTLVLLMTRG